VVHIKVVIVVLLPPETQSTATGRNWNWHPEWLVSDSTMYAKHDSDDMASIAQDRKVANE
jgi:hypothetical protein